MSERTVSLGLIQMRALRSRNDNLARALVFVREAAAQGAEIICLQELFLTPYFPQTEEERFFEWAEEVHEANDTVRKLSSLAKELGVVLIGSLFEKAEGKFFNTAVVLDADGRYLGKYRKMHIPEDPQFHEKFYFSDGDLDYPVFQTQFARIGVLICWDQWFPEPARVLALKGAEILFYPTAIGWLPEEKEALGEKQFSAWQVIQRSHAVANGCFVASVNRSGFEPYPGSEKKGIEFWGKSFIAGPLGEIIREASTSGQEILVAQVALDEVTKTRKAWPFFRDRRLESYRLLCQQPLEPAFSHPRK